MEVIAPTQVTPLILIVDKLLNQTLQQEEFRGKEYARLPDSEVFHYSEMKTGEFIIFDFTPGSETYILKMAELKNCKRDKCYLSVYGADLERQLARDVDWFVFYDENDSKARSRASHWAHKLKNVPDIKRELWGPLFENRKEILKFIESIIEGKTRQETHFSIAQKAPREIRYIDDLGYEIKFGIKPMEEGCRIISIEDRAKNVLGAHDVFSYFFDISTGAYEKIHVASFRDGMPEKAQEKAEECFKKLMEE
jgi:hypothetical protein